MLSGRIYPCISAIFYENRDFEAATTSFSSYWPFSRERCEWTLSNCCLLKYHWNDDGRSNTFKLRKWNWYRIFHEKNTWLWAIRRFSILHCDVTNTKGLLNLSFSQCTCLLKLKSNFTSCTHNKSCTRYLKNYSLVASV